MLNPIKLAASDLSLRLSIISTSGISGPSPRFMIEALVQSPNFKVGGQVVSIALSLYGSIRLRALTDKTADLGDSEVSVEKFNREVLSNCFNVESEYSCFSVANMTSFFDVSSVMYRVKVLDADHAQTYELPKDVTQHVEKVLSDYLASIKESFQSGAHPECKKIIKELAELNGINLKNRVGRPRTNAAETVKRILSGGSATSQNEVSQMIAKNSHLLGH